MSTWIRRLSWVAVMTAACSPQTSTDIIGVNDGGRVDVPRGDTGVRTDAVVPDTGPLMCTDTDGDGLSDQAEGAPAVDTDSDGMPDFRDTDSDNDGYSDRVESTRTYPNYDRSARPQTCGTAGDNCDAPGDTVPNQRDLDADNDGLTDREEMMAGTNPCSTDTDGDGAPDLTEVAAGSDGRNGMSRPPENSLYVVLPYFPPDMPPGMHEFREFTFSTRIRQADVFFLVDNSASMQPIIENLRSNFSSVIVPGVSAAIPDIRLGVGSFDSMPDGLDGDPGMPGDYTLWVRQGITNNPMAVQNAFNLMHTIDDDTCPSHSCFNVFVGGDGPENSTEAAFEAIEGSGSRGHESDAAALRSVRNALDPAGNGWVPRVDPMRDCPRGDAARYGWACFSEGRVPIMVLASDADWYDGCSPGSPRSRSGHNCDDLVNAITMRGGFFVGIDVGVGVGGPTYTNARAVAMRTRTLDGSGVPIVFGPGRNVAPASMQIVDAITRFAGSSRQDITTRSVGDPMAMNIPTGHTTADFIKAVVPARGIPDMPEGYDRRDMTTFYNVAPSTQVVFRADFYNDFVPGAAVARLFRATIDVLGRGGTVVDSRPVFIVVPAQGATVSPG